MNMYFDPHNYFEKAILPAPPSSTLLAKNIFFSAQEEINARLTKIEERLAKLEGEI